MTDSQWIPGMFSMLDRNGDPVGDCLVGNVPIIISAPHAGQTLFADGSKTDTNPPGANQFGTRQRDPTNPQLSDAWFNVGGFNDSSGDNNTRHIAFGIIRRLIDLGVCPYAVINRVIRYRVDLARPWELQHLWSNGGDPLTPAQVESRNPDFRRDYHARYHDTLASFVRQVHPQRGWLFDIHGQGAENRVALSTTAGWMARSDWVYLDGAPSFFNHLQMQGLNPIAVSRKPEGIDGREVNFIPGLLHGATDPYTIPDPPQSRLDPVVLALDRVHGVHIEIEGVQRVPTSGTREAQINEMERLGARVGSAIYGFLEAHSFFAPARILLATREREMDEAWYAVLG